MEFMRRAKMESHFQLLLVMEGPDQRPALEHFKLAQDQSREVRVGFRVAIGVWFDLKD